jgi:glycosyltransferase involved in cell wall biosynthesis
VRILYLAYHFPPIGGAAVLRNANFVRHLQALGHEPVVVTGPGAPSYRWTPLDSSLGSTTGDLEVHRIAATEPSRGNGMRGRAERWLGIHSPWERWWREHVVPLAVEAGADAELVHASIAPYASWQAALAVAHRLQKPLVVDFEDPWALDEMLVYPSRFHRRADLRRMRRTVLAADAVVMNTDEARTRLVETFPELGGRVATIWNGFARKDFERPVTLRKDGRFRIVHTGSLHTELGQSQRRFRAVRRALGGSVAGVEFLSRSHVYLLQALERAAGEGVHDYIEVHLAGVLTDADRAVAERSPAVLLRGFLSHPETVDAVRSADLLFLPMHDLPETSRATVVPCKTYEYLASGRPILGAVPNGDVRDLLASSPTATLCRPVAVDAMAAAIVGRVREWQTAGPVPDREVPGVDRFEWRRLTGELVALYERLLLSPGPVSAPFSRSH